MSHGRYDEKKIGKIRRCERDYDKNNSACEEHVEEGKE
jgi:hypothetical protein